METNPLVLLVGVYDSKAGADTHDEAGAGCGDTRGLLRRPSPNRAAQAPLMMTGSWELQVSIAAPAGVDNLIPLSVTG